MIRPTATRRESEVVITMLNVCSAFPPKLSSAVTFKVIVVLSVTPGVPLKVLVEASNTSQSGISVPSDFVTTIVSLSLFASVKAFSGRV